MEQTILGNRYQIIKKIGDGGMAFVYQAKDKLLNRIVAVKVLRPEFVDDKDFLAKFKREAEAVANITHPNIVNVYDVGQEGKVHYIVMEYVDGQNLKEIIKNEGVLDEYTALDITKQIAQALSAAHKKGVIHRDIKPHNILISNEDRQVKVADFGIAKAVSNSTITNIGSIIGSVHYFSPEQAKGQPVANNADLYSLGIVLYEMLIGRVPFRGDSPISIALQHINEEIEFTQEEKTKIPHSIRTLISKMTEKSPEDRYQSAEEVIEDIDYIEKNIDLDFIKEYDNYVTQKIDQDKLLAKSKRYNTNRNYYEEDLEDYSDEYEDEEDYYEEQKPVRKSNKNNVSKKAKKKKRNNTKKIIIGVIALAVVVVALFGGKLAINAFLNNNTSSNGQVESFDVPNFVGISIDDANKQAAKLGLNIQTTEEYNTEVKAGYIISQSPQMGKVQTGDTINVVVSLGGKAATVPNCVGMSYEKAKKLIESNNLKVGSRSYEYSDSYEEGVVIWQNPSSGTNGVMQNTTVDLVISKGKKPEDNTTKPDDNNQNNSGDNNNSDNSGDNNDSNTDNPGDNNNPNNPGDSGNTDNNGSSGNTESQQNASIRKGDYWV
ncbi:MULTISPECIES: Stk1 family PASTA domain-containing Ser/Thr kinase [Clostridia]|uniref:Stk1 family PASTA domain-containing Ser/Thr kinase n=1 Tax=Clostridia TaxID=186801 RepID=UPI0018AB6067|nr:Stk1 family PASTA domain-containing Ser/Thr kinase [uncultured Intestinibacter sp.]